MDQNRPIVLDNFLYKVTAKVLSVCLAEIASRIVLLNQFRFIKGCHIEDCIIGALEIVNLLNHKCFGNNHALKIDIRKAFDLIRWPFMIRVLEIFGVSACFCSCI